MSNPLRSSTWLIIEVALILAILGLISFWKVPVYEKGTAMAMVVFADALKVLLGYTFGRTMPQQTTDAKPGQSSQSTTSVQAAPEPPPTTDPAPVPLVAPAPVPLVAPAPVPLVASVPATPVPPKLPQW